MIKRIKDRLAVKVFILTAVLLAACCEITYLCIAHFSPYIYTHTISEAEEMVFELYMTSPNISQDEAPYLINDFADILAAYTDDEFVFHIFNSSGEELALPDLRTNNGRRIEDYEGQDKSEVSLPLWTEQKPTPFLPHKIPTKKARWSRRYRSHFRF